MMCKFNKFKKKADNKTAFIRTQGEPIFKDTIYIINPIYIRRGSPELSLVCHGRHISGLFKVANNWYSGDYQSKGLLLFINSDWSNVDLFLTDLPPIQVRQLLLEGRLNELLFKAREEALKQ